jgi:hypothetical protein
MLFSKAWLASLVTLGLLLGAIQPASAQDAFNPDSLKYPDSGGIFQIADSGVTPHSGLGARAKGSSDSWACVSTKDPQCADFSKLSALSGDSVLPPCASEKQENCIVSLELSTEGQAFQPATLIRSTIGMAFPEDKALNYVGGSTPSLWSAEHAPSASGTTNYVVVVRLHQARYLGERSFSAKHFLASVIPYREQAGDFKAPTQVTITADPQSTGASKSYAAGGSGFCAWSEDGLCGFAQDFADGTKVRLKIRIPNGLSGWLQGRLDDPTLNVERFSATSNTVTVEAQPVTVQRLVHTVQGMENITQRLREFVNAGYSGMPDSFMTWASSYEKRGFDFLREFKGPTRDTAAGESTYWNFGSSHLNAQGSRCLQDTSKLLGLVTTNATVFDGGAPKFSKGLLNYRVGGLHFESDGQTEALGTYDLVMRSEVARCLYGFSKAPVSATITISGDGDKNIATTTVSEKGGWLKLAASGFTFSEKTLKVKLTQKKQTTITCVASGKKSVKVTAASPKCPKGYKKR